MFTPLPRAIRGRLGWPTLPRQISSRPAAGRWLSTITPTQLDYVYLTTKDNKFNDFQLNSDLVRALHSQGYEIPTEIQEKTIPKVLSRADVVCAAETGTGKTLAFLLPIVELLKRDEHEARLQWTRDRRVVQRPVSRPRAVILVPSRELVYQTVKMAKELTHWGKFSIRGVTKNSVNAFVKKGQPIDVMVCTPLRLLQMRNAGKIGLANVHHIVLDEADTLFSPGFAEDVIDLLHPLVNRARPKNEKQMARHHKLRIPQHPPQIILSGATLLLGDGIAYKGSGRDEYRSPFTALKSLEEMGSHRFMFQVARSSQTNNLPTKLKYSVKRSNAFDKIPALMDVVQEKRYRIEHKPNMIVFCNSIASIHAAGYHIEDALDQEGERSKVFYMHKELPKAIRKQMYEDFCASKPGDGNVLIASDLGSRGINFEEVVDCVVMFDIPHSLTDYIHRVGRTARGNNKGEVVMVVGSSSAEKAREAAFGEALRQANGKTKVTDAKFNNFVSRFSAVNGDGDTSMSLVKLNKAFGLAQQEHTRNERSFQMFKHNRDNFLSGRSQRGRSEIGKRGSGGGSFRKQGRHSDGDRQARQARNGDYERRQGRQEGGFRRQGMRGDYDRRQGRQEGGFRRQDTRDDRHQGRQEGGFRRQDTRGDGHRGGYYGGSARDGRHRGGDRQDNRGGRWEERNGRNSRPRSSSGRGGDSW